MSYHPQYVYVQESPRRSGLLAGLMSLFVPGLGQLYKGYALWALFWFVVTPLGYAALVVPGLLMHVMCVYFAIASDARG